MTEEFLDYIEDIIAAMTDAVNFVKDMEYAAFVKDKKDRLRRNKSYRNYWRSNKKDTCLS